MAVIASFKQQPAEVLDYDVDYTDWLPSSDSVGTATSAVSPVGLVVDAQVVSGKFVKLWVSGGTSGVKYKVTLTVETAIGRTKQDEILFTVKDI